VQSLDLSSMTYVYIRALWRLFGPKRETATSDRTSLHNEELHNLYTSTSMRVIITRWFCIARMGGIRNAYKNLNGKT
jgi:hypothetical protein